MVLTINNLPPSADAGGPYVADEGEELHLDATQSTGAGGENLIYAWDLDGDGQFDDATGTGPTIPWATVSSLLYLAIP